MADAFSAPRTFRSRSFYDASFRCLDRGIDRSLRSTSPLATRKVAFSGGVPLPQMLNDRQMSPFALSMVAKSGGRWISTDEQFAVEVLCQKSEIYVGGEDDSDGSDGKDSGGNGDSGRSLPVLVFFSAPWCGPCRLTNPVVKEVMKLYQSQIEVVEISTDDLSDVAANEGILSIPTIQIYYEGKIMDTIVGCVAKNVLARSVDKVLEDLGLLIEEEEGDDREEGDDASP